MARTLKAGLSAVLNGGSIYWMVVLYPNRAGDFGAGITQIVCGNIRAHGFGAETTVWTNRLLQISELDQRGDPFASPLAEIPDASFEIADTGFTLDPTDYIGRRCEIRMGYGDTMSLATSDVMGGGRLYDVVPGSPFTLRFTVRGKTQGWNREVGTVIPETAHERYRGKIKPIVYGDHTDSDAYIPLMVTNQNVAYGFNTEARPVKAVNELRLWDEKNKMSYAVTDTTQFNLNATKTYLAMAHDTGCRTIGETSETTTRLLVTDYENILFEQSTGTDVPSACYLQIDDEVMLVYRNPNGSIIYVERAQLGTVAATHANNTAVFQLENDTARLRIKLNHDFYPKAYSGMVTLGMPATSVVFDLRGKIGRVENAVNGTDYLGFPFSSTSYAGQQISTKVEHLLNMVFPDLGIDGEVLAMSALIDCYATMIQSNTNYFGVAFVDLVKDGATYSFNGERNFTGQSRVSCVETNDDLLSSTVSFNNISGAQLPIVLASNMRISEVADLSDSRYSIAFGVYNDTLSQNITASMYVKRAGLRIDFGVSPFLYDFYWRGKGRVNPGTYYNGAEDDLIENPSSVVEDFLRQEVKLVDANLSEADFDAVYTDRAAWKMAVAIQSEA